jgi:hypothetical protein
MIKVFWNTSYPQLQDDVNAWLVARPDITVLKLLQSECEASITITILYMED